jgi:hypothetical protein
MRRLIVPFLMAGVVALVPNSASAQSDTSTVTYTISPVTLVEIAADVSMTINAVNSVGGGLTNATDSTTYAITNNAGAKKLVGKLNTAMPSNTTLAVQAAAPSGATSIGAVSLNDANQDLVTGIGAVDEVGVNLSFTFGASVNAALVSGATKTLTLTLVDES